MDILVIELLDYLPLINMTYSKCTTTYVKIPERNKLSNLPCFDPLQQKNKI